MYLSCTDKTVGFLRKKLTGECPCGYVFETLKGIDDAVLMVQVHVDNFHKNHLPFGITKTEVLELLKKARKIKPKTKFADRLVLSN